MITGCRHPIRELRRMYTTDLQPLPGQVVCALCGGLVHEPIREGELAF